MVGQGQERKGGKPEQLILFEGQLSTIIIYCNNKHTSTEICSTDVNKMYFHINASRIVILMNWLRMMNYISSSRSVPQI